MAKNYVGCCGYCKHMDLRSGYTSAYSTSFKCTRNNYSVKADEKSCNKFEADGSLSLIHISIDITTGQRFILAEKDGYAQHPPVPLFIRGLQSYQHYT